MSVSNLESVLGHYQAAGRGDLAGMLAPLTPATEWIEMAGSPCPGTFVGPDAVAHNVFAAISRDWDGFVFAPERMVDGGDTIIVIGEYRGSFRATGRTMRARVVHVWDMDGGKVRRFEQFADTALMAAAASV